MTNSKHNARRTVIFALAFTAATTLMPVYTNGASLSGANACDAGRAVALSIDSAHPKKVVKVRTREDCSLEIIDITNETPAATQASGGAKSGLARPVATAYSRSCRSENTLRINYGDEYIMTRFTTWLKFEYDYSSVTSFVDDPWYAYVNWAYGYSFGDGPVYDAYTSTPSSSINVIVQKAFNRWGVGDHTKANQMYGYYDGSCATNFWHWNYVCTGCWVEYALFYE